MFDDKDIKIAGNRPSDSVKRNNLSLSVDDVVSESQISAAKKLGIAVAEEFSAASNA